MAVEYNAIALGIAALMFYLLELASRLNFQTSGKSFIDINDLAKTILMFCSISLGIGLALFMYGVSTGNSATIDAVLLVVLRFWIVMTSVVLLFTIIYYMIILPKLVTKVQGDD